MKHLTVSKKWKRFFGPEGGDGANGAPNGPPGMTTTTNQPAPPPAKSFSQAEVDKVVQERLAAEKAKHNKVAQEHLTRIAALETDSAKKAELEKQIEALTQESLTKEQVAAQERHKAEQAWQKKLEAAESSSKSWQKRYTEEKVLRELTDAAAAKDVDAFNPMQLVTQLQHGARVVEKMVNGKPTGELETRVKYVASKDGQPVELDLTPAEAVKALKEDAQFGNFFRSNVVGGTGTGQPRSNGKPGDPRKMSQDEINKRWREGGINALGLT